jgi:hypothetical protein
MGALGPVRRLAGRAYAALPEGVRLTLFPGRAGYTRADVPDPVVAPSTATRLYIGRSNSAGQGWAWARAAERLPGVGAVSAHVRRVKDFGYPVDYSVSSTVFTRSARWARGQFDAVSSDFTHLIAESQWAQFGTRFDGDVVREFDALRTAGVVTAALCHGSDIRSPQRHREHEPFSPFHDRSATLTTDLTASTAEKARILDELGGLEFVSTPDLLLDRPAATWLPVVVDPARWRTAAQPLEEGVPVVVHAPSFAGLKGTELVIDALRDLASAGDIDFRLVEGVPAAEMPAVIAEADIVLDQFSLGIYGVATCEALAAGRVVVSHVSEFVRESVLRETGRELPVVEATADTLLEVLADVRARREHYRAIAAQGPSFVKEVHDGERSAAVLAAFLGAR